MVDGLTGEIWAALERGETVLTGNQRAARALRRAVDARNRAEGRVSWAPAKVLAWSTWAAGLWRALVLEGKADAMLLNRSQEAALWRGVIEADEALATLRGTDALAGMAAEAWAALSKYRGLGRLKGSATNGDTEAFAGWAEAFEERCRLGRFLPEARLEGALRRAVRDGDLQVAGGILLVGFDRLLPAQVALLDAIAETGVGIETAAPWGLPEQRSLASSEDEAAELRLAAVWIRGFLAEHMDARVAVVVPGLREQRARVERVFREVLAPETQAIGVELGGPFEFSAGLAFGDRAAVAAALDLLAWAERDLELERVSRLLLSPSCAGGAETAARAEFDAFELRSTGMLRPEIGLEWLIGRVARSKRAARLGGLLGALRGLHAVASRRLREQRAYGDWAEAMREMLAAAGWGARAEDSIEFQVRERWESALDELATLDFEGGRVSYGTALEAVRRIVGGTVFAPESREAPVQILGPEETAGQSFDAVWFLRVGDMTWPAAAPASPLLSWPLRRELAMPGSEASADTADARWVTDRVARCAASTIVFSYARETADGVQRPSAVLAGLELSPFDGPVPQEAEALVEIEEIEDSAPIAPLPDRLVEGGAKVLQAQAACGFRAFAEHRLYASEIEARAPGMDARERGIAVHTVLEKFWEEVRTQAALRAMTTEERRAVLERVIDHALRRAVAETPWDEAYVETQRRRLLTVGMDWLAMEAARSVPFTVTERELAAKDVAIGPLRLSLRIDRVDEVPGGSVLIDYKTGEAKASAWLSDRPDEPQLPLYAVLEEGLDLQAVAFGKVRPGKDMGLAGFEETAGILTHPARGFAGMEAQLAEWRGTLTTLAEGFAGGDARVSPKQYPVTCAHCGQRLICRVDGAALERADDDEGEDELG